MDINRDNWGHRARIGMFIVGSEAVPEAEWWAMMPADISVHTARVTARAPWANWDSEHHDLELSEDLSRGLKQFASMSKIKWKSVEKAAVSCSSRFTIFLQMFPLKILWRCSMR